MDTKDVYYTWSETATTTKFREQKDWHTSSRNMQGQALAL